MSPLGPPRNTLTHKLSRIHTTHTHDRSSCHCEVRHQHSRKEKKNKNTSMVKIISTITMLQFIKYFFQRSDSGFSSRFKAVCVCVVVVFVIVFVPLLQTHTHRHRHARTHTTNIRTLTRSSTHHVSSFSGERHGAMERHSSSPSGRTDHQEETGFLAAATKGHPGHRHSLLLLCEGSAYCTPPRSHSACWPGLHQGEGWGCSLRQCSLGQIPGQGLQPLHSFP